LAGLKPAWSGKVRDIYIPPDHYNDLLAVVTLTGYQLMTKSWERFRHWNLSQSIYQFCKNLVKPIVSSDFLADDLTFFSRVIPMGMDLTKIRRAEFLGLSLKPFLWKFIVRGYLAGSLWKEYSENDFQSGYYQGNFLPVELCEGEKLDFPIFTPRPKARLEKKISPWNIAKCWLISMNGFKAIIC
jgi:phosphoribosylaminoimidazole-succinocarboxamide synthase